MDERVQFIADFLSDGFTMTELCERYGISRPTGYKWVARHAQQEGLHRRHRFAKREPVTHDAEVME